MSRPFPNFSQVSLTELRELAGVYYSGEWLNEFHDLTERRHTPILTARGCLLYLMTDLFSKNIEG